MENLENLTLLSLPQALEKCNLDYIRSKYSEWREFHQKYKVIDQDISESLPPALMSGSESTGSYFDASFTDRLLGHYLYYGERDRDTRDTNAIYLLIANNDIVAILIKNDNILSDIVFSPYYDWFSMLDYLVKLASADEICIRANTVIFQFPYMKHHPMISNILINIHGAYLSNSGNHHITLRKPIQAITETVILLPPPVATTNIPHPANIPAIIPAKPNITPVIRPVITLDDEPDILRARASEIDSPDSDGLPNMYSRDYIYLIREFAFRTANRQIFKIGKTTREPFDRLKEYSKGAEIILITRVDNCHIIEKELIKIFTEKYTRKMLYGYEYFEGDEREMVRTINRHLKLI